MSPAEKRKQQLQLELLGLSAKRNQQALEIGDLEKQYAEQRLNLHSKNHDTSKQYDAIDNDASITSPTSTGDTSLSPSAGYVEPKGNQVQPPTTQPDQQNEVPVNVGQQQLPNDAMRIAQAAMAGFPMNDPWDTHPLDYTPEV